MSSTPKRRDDFSEKVTRLLAERVAYICSRPECRRLTIGPHSEQDKSLKLGIAAHITAAAPGGPRYDSSLTPTERKSYDNGVWLCVECASLIDKDDPRFTVPILNTWKKTAEDWARQENEGSALPHGTLSRTLSLQTLSQQLERTSQALSSEVEKDLERIREAWRHGRPQEVTDWIKSTNADATRWNALTPDIQARILRFEASIELSLNNDVDTAKRLAEQARALTTSPAAIKLDILIRYWQDGAVSALSLLSEPDTVDLELINLRAALLLEAGQVDDCLMALDVEHRGAKPDAETFRMRALAYLYGHDIQKARHCMGQAHRLKPRWESILYTGAMVEYFSALSPIALTTYLPPWPQPVDWFLVKQDVKSCDRFAKATKVFRQLVDRHVGAGQEKQIKETWYLACLANQETQQEAAARLCQELLSREPSHFGAIAWAITRQYEFDRSASEQALVERVEDNSVEIPHLTDLLILYHSSERHDLAVELLVKTKAVFESRGALPLWELWYTRARIASRTESAEKIVDEITQPEIRQDAQTLFLQSEAERTGNPGELLRHYDDLDANFASPYYLLEASLLRFRNQDWAYVADHAEQLVTMFETAEVLKFVTLGAYNAHRWDLCLRLIHEHRGLYRVLPLILRRIRIDCQQSRGDLGSAIAEAEALAKERPNTENLLDLMQLHLRTGDLRRVADLARVLQTQPDLSPAESLRLARLIRTQDRSLASLLWRKAVQGNLPDEAIGEAFALSFQLGTEDEAFTQGDKFQPHEAGSLRWGSTTQLLEMTRQHQEQLQRLNQDYRHGSMPIHVFAAIEKISLATLYHSRLSDVESNPAPHLQWPTLIRHGGRSLLEDPSSLGAGRLRLDTTAILLAHHLDILEKVETTFGQLWIPVDLVPALLECRDLEANRQLNRFNELQEALAFIDRGRIDVVSIGQPPGVGATRWAAPSDSAWLEQALSEAGFVVDFLPSDTAEPILVSSPLPDHLVSRLLNLRTLVDGLLSQGQLSSDDHARARAALGTEGQAPAVPVSPPIGAPLYCNQEILLLLVDAGLLERLARLFRLKTSEFDRARMKAELQDYVNRAATVAWLDGLVDHINAGFKRGVYHHLPISARSQAAGMPPEPMMMSALRDVLESPIAENDVIWIDDRALNANLAHHAAPIIGINEILQALRTRGALTPNAYFQLIERLRAANVRWMPLDVEEILFYIDQVSIKGNQIIEPSALANLRRHVAACLSDGELLQKFGTGPNPHGETAFLIGVSRPVIAALARIWNGPTDLARRQLQSDWLMHNLYLDWVGLIAVSQLRPIDGEELPLSGQSLSKLMSVALGLVPARRREYIEWIYSSIIYPLLEGDAALASALTGALKYHLLSSWDEPTEDPNDQRIKHQLLQAYYTELPKRLREELQTDSDLIAHLNLRVVSALGDVQADRDELWTAVAQVINGGRATLPTLQPPATLSLEPLASDEPPGFTFQHPISKAMLRVADDYFAILSDDPTRRAAVLERNSNWFDAPADQVATAIASVNAIDDPARRAEALSHWRDRSATVFYANLREHLSEDLTFTLEDLFPSEPDTLTNHYRLPTTLPENVTLSQTLDRAAAALVKTDGLPVAVERYCRFPVPLPPSLLEAVSNLPPEQQRALFRELLQLTGSPVSRLHLVYLLTRFSDGQPAYGRLARTILKTWLGTSGLDELAAFLVVLRWVAGRFWRWPGAARLSRPLRLAMTWAHAHQLFAILNAANIQTQWLQTKFSRIGQLTWPDTLGEDHTDWLDVAHPRRVSAQSFVVMGLGYAVEERHDAILDDHLRNALTAIAYNRVGQQQVPHAVLLRDTTENTNVLDSFLGADPGLTLSRLTLPPDAIIFSAEQIHSLITDSVNQLKPDQLESWAWLFLLIGDLPMTPQIARQFLSMVKSTPFADLFRNNVDRANSAFELALSQTAWHRDLETHDHLVGILVHIAESLAERERQGTTPAADSQSEVRIVEHVGPDLLNDALLATLIRLPGIERAQLLAKLLDQMVQAWPALVPMTRSMVEQMCQRLPAQLSRHLAPLLVKLRAWE